MPGGLTGWGSEEYGEPGSSTEQRRLRHLTEILVRNLNVSALYEAPSTTNVSARDRYPHLLAAGLHDGSSSKRPHLSSRTSRDDIDLHLPLSLQKRNQARRKRAISSLSSGLGEVAERGSRSELQYRSLSRANSAGSTIDKGKGRAIDQDAVDQTLDRDEDEEDTDLVFGWMSASTPALTRSKSKGSIKSTSSRRSSSSFGKRLFRHGNKHSANHSDEEDDETSHAGPASPSGQRVSFQFTAEPQGYREHLSSSIGRNRSASKGSILSVASGSSGSTIRQTPSKFSEKEERKLRQKRQDHIRNHLVRSRLTLSLPAPSAHGATPTTARPIKPSLPRSRTVSFPLSPSGASFVNGQDSSPVPVARGHAKRSKPFSISPIHAKSMDPSFALDPADLLVPPDMQDILQREDRLVASLWVEKGQATKDSSAVTGDIWQLLLEWEIDLGGLTSLGTDPLLFPEALPDNTLTFKLSNTNEYYTARLPAFASNGQLDEQDQEGLSGISEVEDGHDGNLSDPGPDGAASLSRSKGRKAALLIGRDKREREKMLARRRLIIERSVRETKMLQSVDDEQLQRIVGKEREVELKRRALKEIRRRTDEVLQEEVFLRDREHGQLEHTVCTRQGDLEQLDAGVHSLSKAKEAKIAALEARRQRLQDAMALLDGKKEGLIKSQAEHEMDESVLSSVRMSFAQRRAHLVSELSSIFPIEPVDSGNLLFSICGLSLPNSNYDVKLPSTAAARGMLDDDNISSALGYAAQVVNLLAAYLAVPLYYPLRCMGSRSLVQDPISQIKGTKIFPLYSKAVDKYRFDYAVFLLNKDIEQLMVENGIAALDLRQTLPNLKNLYLTLSTDATSQGTLFRPQTPAAARRAVSSPVPFPDYPGQPNSPSPHARPIKQLAGSPLRGRKPGLNGTAFALEKILETSLVSESGSVKSAKTPLRTDRRSSEIVGQTH